MPFGLPPPGSGARRGAGGPCLRPVDVLGVVALVGVVGLLAVFMTRVGTADLRVYHLAVHRIGSDDVYDHLYPRWPFTYPPAALLLMWPLGGSFTPVRWGVFVGSVAATVVTMRLTIGAAAPGSRWTRPGPVCLASALMLVSPPVVLGLALGQAAPAVLALSAAGAYGRRDTRSGVAMGVAMVLKLTPAIFVALWLVVGRVRRAGAAVLVFVALVGLGWLVLPASSTWYLARGGFARAEQVYATTTNQSITGTVARGGWDDPASRLAAAVLCGLLLVLALLVARGLVRAGWYAVAVPLVGVWSGLASPVGWIHAFGWWVPLAVAVALTGRTRADLAAGATILVLPCLVVLDPWGLEGTGGVLDLAWNSNYLLVGCGATGWLWWRVRRGPGLAGPPPPQVDVPPRALAA